jgi:tight adherence protein B
MNFIANRNKKKFEKQIPDAFNLLTNSIKGGSELSEALEIVVKKSPSPIRRSFQSISTKIKLGGKVEDVLKFEKENVTDIDFNVLASAISISVRTGGRLVPILERFQEIMQNRAKLMNKIILAIAIAKTNGRTLMAILGCVTAFNLLMIESNRDFFFETELGNQLLQLVIFLVILYEILLRIAAWWAARK